MSYPRPPFFEPESPFDAPYAREGHSGPSTETFNEATYPNIVNLNVKEGGANGENIGPTRGKPR